MFAIIRNKFALYVMYIVVLSILSILLIAVPEIEDMEILIYVDGSTPLFSIAVIFSIH